jgi:hypothetical protein
MNRMKSRKFLAIVAAFIVGGIGIAGFSLAPQVVEAGVKYN